VIVLLKEIISLRGKLSSSLSDKERTEDIRSCIELIVCIQNTVKLGLINDNLAKNNKRFNYEM